MNQIPIPISFIILNYNGKELTENCIKSLVSCVSDINYEIIVVDNGSNDGSLEYLKDKFPSLKIVEEGYNKFIAAYNDGVKEAKGEWVFLLNNDMLFTNNFVSPLLPHLNNNDLFAVGSVMFSYDGSFQKGANLPSFRCGYFWFRSVYPERPTYSIYIGTHGLFRKKLFLEIGGFDELYSPFYMEDVDLCYRAWKKGFKVLVEPGSIIYHKHMGTIGEFFARKYVLRVYARNHILFIWKNITSKRRLLEHILCIPSIILGALLKGKIHYLLGFIDAIKLLLERKIKKDPFFVKTDEEVLKSFYEQTI